jgi:hypothetical protein
MTQLGFVPPWVNLPPVSVRRTKVVDVVERKVSEVTAFTLVGLHVTAPAIAAAGINVLRTTNAAPTRALPPALINHLTARIMSYLVRFLRAVQCPESDGDASIDRLMRDQCFVNRK